MSDLPTQSAKRSHSRKPIAPEKKDYILANYRIESVPELAAHVQCSLATVYGVVKKIKKRVEKVCSYEKCHRRKVCRVNSQVFYENRWFCCKECVLDYQAEVERIDDVPKDTQDD